MLRSLYSSISGLQNHQVRMDIIGNNISNVNTTGFKSQRVTFEESFSQLLEGSSRPPGGGGGTNPVQVGLGMSIGSVDTLLTQGNISSTGQITDLAIEGDSYFAVSNGEETLYTRNGSFQIDSEGQLVLPTNGYVLQGKIADNTGEFPAGTVIDNIQIPFDEQSPARATEQVNFSRNLNSDSAALGTVVHTQRFLAATEATDTLQEMFNAQGESIGIKTADVITLSADFGAGTTSAAFTVTDTSTLDDLRAAMETFIAGGAPGSTVTIDGTAGSATEGAVIVNANANISNFMLQSDNPLSSGFLATSFFYPATMTAGDTENSTTFRSPASSTDNILSVMDDEGRTLGLEAGDPITVTANVGNNSYGGTSTPTVQTVAGAGNLVTMQDLMDHIRNELRLPERDGSINDNLSVSMNAPNSDDNVTDGSIVIRGQQGEDFSITGLSILAQNSDLDGTAPNNFTQNVSAVEFQQARDTGVYDTSITVYDDSGATHVATMTYIHSGQPGRWNWEVSMGGDETIVSGGAGELTFGQDGSVASFTFNDNSSRLTVNPNNGASSMEIQLDIGGPGDFQGITQFEAPTTVSAVLQDGYGTGSLSDVAIDEFGFVTGSFSNGTNRALAQVMLVDFTNPGGLQKIADSVYSISNNSGDPVYSAAGDDSSKIKPGALELSNVELSREFTEMITTQRGYQANSRVITVSDSLLEELVNLKR